MLKLLMIGSISVLVSVMTSCSDDTKEGGTNNGDWVPDLRDGQRLLKVVHLAPDQIMAIEGVIESPGIYGIRVKEAWDLKKMMDADGVSYWVYLRAPSSSPDRPNSVGTAYAASSKFTPGEGINYELANETPINLTVAIYAEDQEQ